MRSEPLYTAIPSAAAATATNTTTAVTALAADANRTFRAETWLVYNGHTATVDIEFIINDGTTDIIIYKAATLAAGATLEVLAAIYAEPEKRFQIVIPGCSLKIRVTTAVAGTVTSVVNGGYY